MVSTLFACGSHIAGWTESLFYKFFLDIVALNSNTLLPCFLSLVEGHLEVIFQLFLEVQAPQMELRLCPAYGQGQSPKATKAATLLGSKGITLVPHSHTYSINFTSSNF